MRTLLQAVESMSLEPQTECTKATAALVEIQRRTVSQIARLLGEMPALPGEVASQRTITRAQALALGALFFHAVDEHRLDLKLIDHAAQMGHALSDACDESHAQCSARVA